MSKEIKPTLLALTIVISVGIGIGGVVYGLNGQARVEASYYTSDSPVWSWPPPANGDTQVTRASSQIRRDTNGVWYQFNTSELDPNVHTMWLVVFNEPEICQDGCGADDLKAGRGNSAAFWVPGTIVGGNGEGNFGGYVAANYIPSGPDQIVKDNTGGRGLINIETAEIHLVPRTHGPSASDTNILNTQMATFNGGCQPEPDSCKNVQYGVHAVPAE